MEEECPFCNGIEPRSRIIDETRETITILSNPALVRGHCLVIPKRHVEKLSELTLIGEKNSERIIRTMHDCSEGGLAVSIAEMAFGGMLGAKIDLRKMFFEGNEKEKTETVLLFSESNSRILVEVPFKFKDEFEKKMHGTVFSEIGSTTEKNYLEVTGIKGEKIIDTELSELKTAWKKTLNW